MLTGRIYRAELTPDQVEAARQYAGACRAVWNTALAQRRDHAARWRGSRRAVRVNFATQSREVTAARAEFDWLRDVPVHVLQQTLKDLDRACSTHGTWKVKFRAKHRWNPSMRFPDPKQIRVTRLNRKWGEVVLPKFGPVRFRWSRALGGQVRNATLSKDGGHWRLSFMVDTGVEAPAPALPSTGPVRPVGIDVGVVLAVTTSEGYAFDRKFLTPGETARAKRLQQALARQRRTNPAWRTSNRRKRTRAELQAVLAKGRHRRTDFHHQGAATLTREHDLVAVENIKVRSMTKSASGTVEEPGTNVRQKAGLNRSILDQGWGAFLNQVLPWHALKRGVTVVHVPAHHTSQTCPECGNVDANNRESQAVFACTSCSFSGHADVVAATNVRQLPRPDGRGLLL